MTHLLGLQVISVYLQDKYSELEPSFTLATPELRAKAASITRVLDVYINSVQVRLLTHRATES